MVPINLHALKHLKKIPETSVSFPGRAAGFQMLSLAVLCRSCGVLKAVAVFSWQGHCIISKAQEWLLGGGCHGGGVSFC